MRRRPLRRSEAVCAGQTASDRAHVGPVVYGPLASFRGLLRPGDLAAGFRDLQREVDRGRYGASVDSGAGGCRRSLRRRLRDGQTRPPGKISLTPELEADAAREALEVVLADDRAKVLLESAEKYGRLRALQTVFEQVGQQDRGSRQIAARSRCGVKSSRPRISSGGRVRT
jgi:hypothetical protein